MILNQVLNQIQVKTIINDYLTIANSLQDVGVNSQMVEVMEYMIQNQVLNRYKNFTMLYDEQYTIDNITVIITEAIPELATLCVKNSIAISKVFSKLENLKDSSSFNNNSTQSYSGLNAEDVYQSNNQSGVSSNFNPLVILGSIDINFKKCLNVMKEDIEKLLQLYYML